MSSTAASKVQDRDLSETADGPTASKGARRSWFDFDHVFLSSACLGSIGCFLVAYSISAIDPDYFSRRLISTMRSPTLDAMTTGAVVAKPDGGKGMPVPRVVRAREPVPGDYQIVMVFDDEAILATPDELVRVKVGSVVAGLGEVLRIETTESGGVVATTEATLRSVAD